MPLPLRRRPFLHYRGALHGSAVSLVDAHGLARRSNDGRMGDALRKHDPPLTTFLTMFVAKIGRQYGLPIDRIVKTERVLYHLSQEVQVTRFPHYSRAFFLDMIESSL